MIITEKKPIEEVLEKIKDEKNIVIIGCGRCATSCETGGEKEVFELKEFLQKNGKKVVFTAVPEAACDERLLRLELVKIENADCILSMGCGSGTSAINDLTELPVYPTNNSMFLGVIKRLGEYDERCSMCGECVLGETLGICPVTRCSKGLLNGPCGGSKDGKCEADKERNCGWQMIYDKLKKRNKLDNIKKYWRPKNYRLSMRPQKISKKKHYQNTNHRVGGGHR